MKKRIIFLLFIFIFAFILSSFSLILAAEEKGRPLEITYPEIPGVPTPEYVDVGLPEYVKYIFYSALVFFGLLILGVFIYSGIAYMLSFGNPVKLADAKTGMFSALLGGIILFGAYIIFNTINPQLVILKLPEAGKIEAVVIPGVYLCNYRVDGISGILNNYTNNDSNEEKRRDTRNKAAEELKKAMGKPENPKKICLLVIYSGILRNFVINEGSDKYTIFIIPERKYNTEEQNFLWEYNYGIVLHEEDNFRKKCELFPSPKAKEGNNASLYGQVENYHPKLDFTARSITVFKKLTSPPIEEYEGVTLYEGLGFNQIGWEEEEEEEEEEETSFLLQLPMIFSFSFPSLIAWALEQDPNLLKLSFKPNKLYDARIVNKSMLEVTIEMKTKTLYQNTRSIEIKPKNKYFAILLGDEKKEATKGFENEKCEVRKMSDANLTDDSIGRCGRCSWLWYTNPKYIYQKIRGEEQCYPCLEYMIVIKGQVL